MSKLIGGSRVYGSLTLNNSIIAAAGAGAGFQNMIVFNTGTTIASYPLPTVIQYPGAKFKVTIVGAGGNGGASIATIGSCGSGGGSGAVLVVILTVVSGLYSLTSISVPYAGSSGSTSFIYNGITYTAGGGSNGTTYAAGGVEGGVGGTFSGITMSNGLVNGLGINGSAGKGGNLAVAASQSFNGGANTPLGFGQGGVLSGVPTGGAGQPGSGYGSGGSGGCSGSVASGFSGGDGARGVMIIEY
jgi:hypothetical protein